MAASYTAKLDERGAIRIGGSDRDKFLQGLVTNDLEPLGGTPGRAVYAGLLSPQGKILFDFFVVRDGETLLLDVKRSKAAELAKRLQLYKLRADVTVQDVSDGVEVAATWSASDAVDADPAAPGVVQYRDPRTSAAGSRIIAASGHLPPTNASASDYDAHRVSLGIPEGGKDFDFGDAYPHEAGFDIFNGVSFKKGCYVGQEIVARMQNKSVVRKRVIPITSSAPLSGGSDVLFGEVPIGKVGTTAHNIALALVRLDRAAEAEDKGVPLTANGITITPDPVSLANYRRSAAARSSAAGIP